MQNLTIKQRILDSFCLLLCAGAVVYVIAVYPMLPSKIPTNFAANGEITGYSSKTSLFILLGVMLFMTASFSVMLRLRALYRNMNLPWTVSKEKLPRVISVTKDLLCWSNLCVTAGNATLLYACASGTLYTDVLWLPYVILVVVVVWFLWRIRKICKERDI